MNKKLFVASLPFDYTSEQLTALFSEAGTVENASMVSDPKHGRSRGFGFVVMATEEEAQKAAALLTGRVLGDRKIWVTEARPQAPKADRPQKREQRNDQGWAGFKTSGEGRGSVAPRRPFRSEGRPDSRGAPPRGDFNRGPRGPRPERGDRPSQPWARSRRSGSPSFPASPGATRRDSSFRGDRSGNERSGNARFGSRSGFQAPHSGDRPRAPGRGRPFGASRPSSAPSWSSDNKGTGGGTYRKRPFSRFRSGGPNRDTPPEAGK